MHNEEKSNNDFLSFPNFNLRKKGKDFFFYDINNNIGVLKWHFWYYYIFYKIK